MRRWLNWLRGIDLPFFGRGLPPIELTFVACARCGSLSGGISGKGPWKNWRTARAAGCRHVWQPRTVEAFRAEATDQFGVDWTHESDWWHHVGGTTHRP
jgi:hypothetical protein